MDNLDGFLLKAKLPFVLTFFLLDMKKETKDDLQGECLKRLKTIS